MLEKTVEAYLVERVRALGGGAYKFTSPARASVPDRIVVLPPGRVYFIEVKRPGGKPTRAQEREHERLRALGADVRVLDSIGAINAFLNEVQTAADGVAATPLHAAVAEMVRMLEEGEWAEHVATFTAPGDELAARLEAAITDLHNARAAVSPATAEPREPIYRSRLLKAPAWTDVSRTEFETCAAKPDQFEVRTLSRLPADAGETVTRQVIIDWVVERWNLEVKDRPLNNVNRRPLDDAWRQFIRHLGVDDVSLLGPRHDDLIAARAQGEKS